MPILARDIDLFPCDLFEQPALGRQAGRGWWALYTIARREKELMRRLLAMKIAFYAPLLETRNRSPAGRIRCSHLPLFPGYVFIHGEESHRFRAQMTNCVSRYLEVPDQADLTNELRQIKQLIESGAPLTPEARLVPGMRVRIRSGVLQGIEGTVIRRSDSARLLVAVQFLGQGVSLELDDFRFEKLAS